MKTIRTIKKEIEAKGFSILEKYSESRINSYFNFYQTHTRNTFVFREFVANQKQSFINSLTNKEFVLVFIDREIRAYKNLEHESIIISGLYNELKHYKEEYDRFLNEYITTF